MLSSVCMIRLQCLGLPVCSVPICFSSFPSIYVALKCFGELMHQSFVSLAPLGPGNSGAYNLSIFKAPLKARHCGARDLVKFLLNAPAPLRLPIVWTTAGSCSDETGI